MTIIEFAYVLSMLLFVAITCFFMGWLRVPWNKAFCHRFVKEKKYGVVFLLRDGFRLTYRVVNLKHSVLFIDGKVFTPSEKCTVYIGSLPMYFFNYKDAKPINMRGIEVKEEGLK